MLLGPIRLLNHMHSFVHLYIKLYVRYFLLEYFTILLQLDTRTSIYFTFIPLISLWSLQFGIYRCKFGIFEP